MLVETLVTLLSAATPQKPPPALVAPASLLSSTPAPGYLPAERAVDNWRTESALSLQMGPLDAARRALGADMREPTRCVKLNNYWCVKSAGWTGEIAADADGHVAFASAEEGAAVAALLLRRYYVDYKLRSARAIVQRWAPAQCAPMIAHPRVGPVASRAGLARMMPQRVVPMGIAPYGIQNTLRARWLAAHGRGGVAMPTVEDMARERRNDELRAMNDKRREAGKRRFDALRAARGGRMAPAPSIMVGGGEADSGLSDTAPASAPLASAAPRGWAGFSCSGELARIANYAEHLAEGVAASPDSDLHLFDSAGRPTPGLERAMANMAAVEIGPDRPRNLLIVAAVAQLRRMLEDPAAALLAEPPRQQDGAATPTADAAPPAP